jgi:cell division protein ZapA
MDEFTISVKIAERPYRLTIKKNEEEIVRKAAKQINERIKDFSDNYAFKDKQDLLAMVSILYATKTISYEDDEKSEKSKMSVRLMEIDKLLSESL